MTVNGLDHRSRNVKSAHALAAIGIAAGIIVCKSANRLAVRGWIGVCLVRLPLDITHGSPHGSDLGRAVVPIISGTRRLAIAKRHRSPIHDVARHLVGSLREVFALAIRWTLV